MSDNAVWFDWENTQRVSARDLASPRSPRTDLDKDAFLKLLITQLQYQDPLNPVDDKEFIAQMAQFTALEQMQNMNQRMSQTQAFGMIGKEVYAMKYNESTFTSEELTGVVTAVQVISGQTYVIIDDQHQVSVDDIQLVFSDGYINSIINLNRNTTTSQSMALIGQLVQGVVTDQNGKAMYVVEAMVDSVRFDSTGRPLLVVGPHEIDPGNILSVGGQPKLIGRDIWVEVTKDGQKDLIEGKIQQIVFVEVPLTEMEDGQLVTVYHERAFAVLEGMEGERFLVNRIDLLADALTYVGRQDFNFQGVNGEVTGVTLHLGNPWLMLGDQRVSFLEYRGIDPDD